MSQIKSGSVIKYILGESKQTINEFEDILNTAKTIVFIPWAPLTIGHLAKAGSVLDLISEKIGAKPMQVILAWLLQKSSCMLPIPGTTNLSHLEDNVKAALLTLDDNTINTLNTIKNIE